MREIYHTLAAQFAFNSSSDNYSDPFNCHRLTVERRKIDFDTNVRYSYNAVFTLHKLSRYHVIHCQVLMRFTINYSSIYLMTVCYCFCIFVITFGCLGIFRLHGGLRLLCLWVRVGCSRTLLVTGLLPLLAVFVKQWG